MKNIRRQITVRLEGPQVVIVAFEDREPEKVQLVVKTLTDIFIQQNIKAQTQETEVAVNFLKDQLKFYRRKIREDEISRQQEQLDRLLLDSTEKHPMVKELRKRIAKLSLELEKDADNVKVMPVKSSSSNKDEMFSYLILKELKEDLSEGKVSSPEELNVKNILLNEKKLVGLAADAKVNQDTYQKLLQRLETARITKELESFKEGTRFTIMEPARLPLRPTKPNKIQLLLLGIVLGAGIGAGVIFLIEMVDQSYKNMGDAKAGLGLPVLGVISAIVTEEEFNQNKQREKFVYTLLSIFFVLMVAVVLVFSAIG